MFGLEDSKLIQILFRIDAMPFVSGRKQARYLHNRRILNHNSRLRPKLISQRPRGISGKHDGPSIALEMLITLIRLRLHVVQPIISPDAPRP